ncbi:hypothetical protein BSK65_07410 [Paenibacillus odorifer]|uniref:DUF4367 domain-containing protein n=1 Tax=Paenibacillus odorifer TaxID=189426 RepID=A0A1R0ZKA3_9BACL|nr:hypothetical protein [Paenibacillus odorifer]OMD52763.1 hypothetical protein BSK51_11020 [Paenibacillus odorifer]OME72192.1 hypothetical protein BSK65_07410 [Paenibacillus odorifer]
MVGQRSCVEEKMIKKMDALGNCDELDVKAVVMKRVRAIHEQQKTMDGEMANLRDELESFSEPRDPVMQKQEKTIPHPSKFRKRLLSGVSAAILLGMIGFGALQLSGLGSLTELDSQSAIDITKPSDGAITLVNSGGKAVVKTVHYNTPVPSTSPAIEKYLSLLATYKEQALVHLNAGEMAAYYVNDAEFTKLAKGLGYGNQLQFAFSSPVYSKYQEFVKELKGTGDFWPELPSILANGYEFEQATFKAASPYMSISTEYKEMLEQFQKKAKVDKTGQKLFMEKIAVNAIESAEVTYHKGDQRITLSLMQSAFRGYPTQVSILEGQTAEKWSMTGTGKEAVFIAASTEKGEQTWSSQNRLYWYDESSQTIRSLNDGLNNSLTREQWQVIANSFIR